MADAGIYELMEKTDRETILDEDDLFDIIQEVEPVKHHWRRIGLGLRLRPPKLSEIEVRYKHDVLACLEEVLGSWLRKEYNWKRFDPPNWSQIVFVVGISSAGSNPALAEKIAENHRKGMQPSTHRVNTGIPDRNPGPVENNPVAPRQADHSLGMHSRNTMVPTAAENNSGTSALVSGQPASSVSDDHHTRAPRTIQPEHSGLTECVQKMTVLGNSGTSQSNGNTTRTSRPVEPEYPRLDERPTINKLNPLKYLDENGEKQRLRVLNQVAANHNWREIGHKLGVRTEDLDIIEASVLKDPKRCAEGMISKWLMSGDRPTWRKLIVAIEDVDLQDLGQRIRKALPAMI